MSTIYDRRDKWGKTRDEMGVELFREKGISKYAFIAGVGEGELPTGLAADSGYILTPDGKIWAFMTGWDLEKLNPEGGKGYYAFRYLREAANPDEWRDSPNYLRARKELGLPLTEEQAKILQKWEEEHK